jgi:hypothetical protein
LAKNIPHRGEAVVRASGIDIAYDSFGDLEAPSLFLIMIEWIRTSFGVG